MPDVIENKESSLALIRMCDAHLYAPLLAGCLCAYFVAEWLKDRPIYEALLQRDMLRTDEAQSGIDETLPCGPLLKSPR